MQNSSNTNSAGLSRPPKRFLKKGGVEKVALQPMQAPPYRASVDFYRVEYAPADHSILKKTLYTANFIFLFKDDVPNELIPANRLGVKITYFREDQAFTNEVQR